jgi:hypothetical protein
VSVQVQPATAAEQAQQPYDDQVNGDDVIQQPRHHQNQNAGDEGYYGGEAQIHVHVHRGLRLFK